MTSVCPHISSNQPVRDSDLQRDILVSSNHLHRTTTLAGGDLPGVKRQTRQRPTVKNVPTGQPARTTRLQRQRSFIRLRVHRIKDIHTRELATSPQELVIRRQARCYRLLASPALPLTKISASVTGTGVGPDTPGTGAPVTGSQLAGSVELEGESESAGWFNRNVTSARGGWISVEYLTQFLSKLKAQSSGNGWPQSKTKRPSTQTRSPTAGQTNSGTAPHVRSSSSLTFITLPLSHSTSMSV